MTTISAQRFDDALAFDHTIYSTVVREDVEIGTRIVTVRVERPPSPHAGATTYAFRERNADPAFGIGKTNGNIYVRERLDREKVENYSLVVIARDGDAPPRTGFAVVRVVVADVNDHRPQFTSPVVYRAIVDETAPVGSVVVRRFACDDRDDGRNSHLSYAIVGGNDDGIFRVLGEWLVLARPPSLGAVADAIPPMHRRRSYRLSIAAWDHGNPPMRSANLATVVVIVQGKSQQVV